MKKAVGFQLLNIQRKHSLLVGRIFLYGVCLSWVYISKLGIDQYEHCTFEYCTLTLFWPHGMVEKRCRSNGSEKFILMNPVLFLPEA